MEFVTAYGPKTVVRKNFDPKKKGEKSLTKQSMKDECDIQFIIDRFQKTGMVEHRNNWEGDYGEFEAVDYHEAMNIVTAANEMFMSLPSKIRSRFGNDPAQYLEFVQDPANITEMRELGLAYPAVDPAQEPAPASTQPAGSQVPAEPNTSEPAS